MYIYKTGSGVLILFNTVEDLLRLSRHVKLSVPRRRQNNKNFLMRTVCERERADSRAAAELLLDQPWMMIQKKKSKRLRGNINFYRFPC